MRPYNPQASIEDACSLAATEFRGITLTQLRDLWTKIAGLADEDGYLQDWKGYDGKVCHKDTVNLYDVVDYLVKPETLARKCSYVELVAPPGTKAQTPRWFVSHWWGEPVKDFIKAVEYHARQRFAPRGEFLFLGGTYEKKPEHEIVGEPADADATYWVRA